MATQGNDPNRDTQEGIRKTVKPDDRDAKAKAQPRKNADVSGANDTGNKSQGGKFDSGNQTNR